MKTAIQLTLLFLISINSFASSLVYTPVNPSFGGSPLNGGYLMNNAQAQNNYTDPALEENEQSELDDFNERLQRALLSRLTSSISSSFTDDSGTLIPGSMETEDYLIEIIDEGNGVLSVTTTDRVSGATTTFIIDSSL